MPIIHLRGGVNWLALVMPRPLANQPIAEMATYGFPRVSSVCFPRPNQRFGGIALRCNTSFPQTGLQRQQTA
jgi:hypothetical protein